MSAWIIPPVPGFLDTGMAPEVYIDGIGGVEFINGNVRVYLVSEQSRLKSDDQSDHRLVTAKIVGPVLNLPQIIGQLAMCLRRHPDKKVRGPRLVR